MNFETSVFILNSCSQRYFISKNYHCRPRNLEIFTNPYTKTKQVVKVMDLGVKEWKEAGNQSYWWSDLRNTNCKKNPLNSSLSTQLCNDMRIHSKIHHQFKLFHYDCWVVWGKYHYVHPPESYNELEKTLQNTGVQNSSPLPTNATQLGQSCLLSKKIQGCAITLLLKQSFELVCLCEFFKENIVLANYVTISGISGWKAFRIHTSWSCHLKYHHWCLIYQQSARGMLFFVYIFRSVGGWLEQFLWARDWFIFLLYCFPSRSNNLEQRGG